MAARDTSRRRRVLAFAVAVGLAIGLAFVLMDTLVDVQVFTRQLLLPWDLVAIWIRMLAIVLSIGGAVLYARLFLAKRDAETSEQRYRTLAESAHDDIFVVEPDECVSYMNTHAAKEFGSTPEKETGKHLAELFSGEVLQRVLDDLGRAFAGTEVYSEAEFHFPGRTSSWLSTRLVPVRSRAGRVMSVLGLSRDITEQKRAMTLSTALNRINEVVHSKLSFDRIMSAVIGEATAAVGTDSGMVLTREEGTWTIRYVEGFTDDVVGVGLTPGEARASELAMSTHKAVQVDDTHSDGRVNPRTVERFGIRSMLLIPLETRRGVTGVMLFSHRTEPASFDDEVVDFAKRVGTTVSLAIENARLYEEQRSVADTLQSAILVLPDDLPGIDFGVLYQAASTTADVGGDFYDLFELEHGKIGITIGDVSGKGIDAATLTSLVKNTLKAYAYEEPTPARVMNGANAIVVDSVRPGVFVTVFFGVLDVATGTLTYCNAGHPPALLRSPAGEVTQLPPKSPIIGAFAESHYVDDVAEMAPGDLLVLYTDGATEARRGSDFFGEERLEAAVHDIDGVPCKELPAELFGRVLDFTGGTLSDDLALLAVALRPAAEADGADAVP